MSDDEDFVSLAVSRDKRLALVQEAISVGADMRDNPTIKALIAFLRSDAELAMAELAETSPLDSNAVGLISSRVRAYTGVKRMIETILTRGKIAEAEIRQQDSQFTDDE